MQNKEKVIFESGSITYDSLKEYNVFLSFAEGVLIENPLCAENVITRVYTCDGEPRICLLKDAEELKSNNERFRWIFKGDVDLAVILYRIKAYHDNFCEFDVDPRFHKQVAFLMDRTHQLRDHVSCESFNTVLPLYCDILRSIS